MRIARFIENALATYLSSESDGAPGGLHRFRTMQGSGVVLGIRTGHDDAGALPEAGYIICEVLETDVHQTVPKLNLFTAPARVAIVYPADNNSDDTAMLASFDDLIEELEHALVDDRITDLLTATGEGVAFRGLTDGIGFQTGINGAQREAQWTLPFAVSGVDKII